MAGIEKERITVRLSEGDMRGLKRIRESGDFSDMSAAMRWCIHFSVALLRAIPAVLANSFMNAEQENEEQNDKVENSPEVPEQKCNCSGTGTGSCSCEKEQSG